ncbi:MAG: efflux RND transporter periplasmic adaptor subunit [Propionicimonas sp.]
MNRKTLLTAGIATAAVLALAGGYFYSASTGRPEVGTAEVLRADITDTVSASGELASAKTAGVYPPAAGTLTKVSVKDGDPVEAGQILAKVASGPLKLAVAQSRAAVSAADAQLDAINRGVPAAIDRSAADAALTAARSQVRTANPNYSAYNSDYQDATADEQDQMRPTLRTLQTARRTATAALRSAEAGLHQLSVAARVSLARRAALDARAAAKRALALAKADLAHAELTAPFAGTVAFEGRVERGSGVAPGVAVFTVSDPKRLDFEAMVNESDIARVASGQAATVTMDAFEQPFTGTVTRVHGDAQTTSTGGVAYQVDVGIDTGDSRALAGMSGSVELATESVPDALVVPVAAVLTSDGTQSVFVVGPDSVVHSRAVTVGISTDTSAQILSGLQAGQRVVTTGAAALTDGQAVRTK